MTSRKIRGFSLMEMMIVIGIGMTVAGISVMAMMPMLNENHIDQAYDTSLSVLRNYRNLAITQSNRYIVTFTAPGTITVQLWGYAVPVSPAPVTVATYTLPPDVTFGVQAIFPAAAPDGFGGARPPSTSTNSWAWAARTTSSSCPTARRKIFSATTTAAFSI
jgi:type II secretory pathway pseudopilin PulG